jgi:uncharacterized membrane protein YeaQ/YmgE (transglycosylase-associated protein family)
MGHLSGVATSRIGVAYLARRVHRLQTTTSPPHQTGNGLSCSAQCSFAIGTSPPQRKKESMGLLWFVIIGAIAGWLAGQFMKGSGFGLLGDIIVGIIGAFIGGYVFRALGVNIGYGLVGSLIVAFVGAVLLLFIVRLFTGRRGGRRIFS